MDFRFLPLNIGSIKLLDNMPHVFICQDTVRLSSSISMSPSSFARRPDFQVRETLISVEPYSVLSALATSADDWLNAPLILSATSFIFDFLTFASI